MHRSFFRSTTSATDYRFRALPPLWIRATRAASPPRTPVYGEPCRKPGSRSRRLLLRPPLADADADVLFPGALVHPPGVNHVGVVGPIVHREAPGEHDNLARTALLRGVAQGRRLLPLSASSPRRRTGARRKGVPLTLSYFHERNGDRRGLGENRAVVFGGDNGNVDGGAGPYTFVSPRVLLPKEPEVDSSSTP